MFAVEFQTHVRDGMIEIPAEYQSEVSGVVRVIVLAGQQVRRTGIIARLLAHPIQDKSFVPLTRDEIYQERA